MKESGIVLEYTDSTGQGRVTRENGEVMGILKKNFNPGLSTLKAGDAIQYMVVMGSMGLVAKHIEQVFAPRD